MARNHGGTVSAKTSVIRGDDDVEIEVFGYYEPEQRGGWTDPSWSSSVTFEYAERDGQPFVLTRDEISNAEQLMLEKAECTDY